MRHAFILSAAAVLLPLMLSGPSFAAGAIAVDDQADTAPQDAGWGLVTGEASREAAATAALRECRKRGNDTCKVVVRFDTCGAYVSSRTHYGIGWGGTLAAAQSMAQEKCGSGCAVVASECE